MKMMSIASGSSGNCIYIGTDHSHMIVDAGISGKRIENGLNEIGLTMKDIDGICVTHEHIDHIKGLGVLARRYGVPIYTTEGTKEAILQTSSVGEIPKDLFCAIAPEDTFLIGDIEVKPISVSHDAADPVAYIAKNENKTMSVITDLGVYDNHIKEKLKNVDVLLLEANHDVRMLQMGSYPYYLKQRILGERGHLSNESCGQLLGQLLHDDFKAVFLGHLSKENNYEELAYETVRMEITMGDNPYDGNDFPIYMAKRDCVSQAISI